MKWKYGTVGTVSHATMRREDLIPAFCEELRSLGHRSRTLYSIEQRIRDTGSDVSNERIKAYYESEDSQWDLDALFDMLNEHAMDFMYFGAHEGDGSDYGFWVDFDLESSYDGITENDKGEFYQDGKYLGKELPKDYTGHVLSVNDHGNMTLSIARRGRITKELWAVV